MISNKKSFLLLTLCVLSAAAPAMLGQGAEGAIGGRVVDSSGGVLRGARVDVSPSGSYAITNAQGEYSITIPPGTYELTVSYVGFTSFQQRDVKVIPGETLRIDAKLEVASASEQILVTAERPHGEAEAINRQRTALNFLQVLPSEVIISLPNANVADALGRLPSVTLERDEGEGKYVQIRGAEPRLNNVTIDGVAVASPESGVRQIKLDVVPSDLVEAVEINKTFTANMDGDAIGGSVNLRTKEALDQPIISLYGQGGYTPILNGRGQDQFGGTIGKRFGKEKKLGILFGGTYDWNGRGIDDIEPAPTAIQCDPGNCGSPSTNAAYYPTYNTMDIREYRYYRARYGFDFSVDYRLAETSVIYLKGLYSHFDNFGDRWVYTPTINSYSTSPYQGGTDGSMTSNSQIRRPVQQIGSLIAGGRHAFGTNVISWDVSAGKSSTRDDGYSSADFYASDPNSPLNNVQYLLDRSNPNKPKFIPQNITTANLYDASQYLFQDIDVNKTYSPQVNIQGRFDYGNSYYLDGHFGTFEVGGKYLSAHKFQESNDIYYNVNDPTSAPMSNFLSSFHPNNYYGGSYQLGPLVDYDKVTSFFNSNPNAFTLDYNKTRQQNDPNNFNLDEKVAGAYFMNTINLGKWQLYGGLRFEETSLNVTGYVVAIDSNGNYVSTSPLKQNSSYLDPLPSAQLRYALTPDSAIRIAYSRSLARPDFSDLPPTVTLNDKKQSISVGNPNLQPTHSNNYDIIYEQYLKPIGLLTGGFFYKDLTDPIYFVNTIVPSGIYQGYQQTQPVNGSSAYLWGFEVAYQQQLSYFTHYLSGFGISANYSYTHSKAYGVPGRSDNPPLQRQAPNTWNISPTYDKGRFSIRVGISYNGANIFQYNYQDGAPLGLKGPLGDNYLYSHLQLDAQGSIRLAKGFSAIIYGLNLSNEVFGFYQGSPQYPIQREYYQPTIGAGLRWSPTRERF